VFSYRPGHLAAPVQLESFMAAEQTLVQFRAMPEQESGLKWWLRYVIVPMIGGGGAIAIIVAMISRPVDHPPLVHYDPPSATGGRLLTPATTSPSDNAGNNTSPSQSLSSSPAGAYKPVQDPDPSTVIKAPSSSTLADPDQSPGSSNTSPILYAESDKGRKSTTELVISQNEPFAVKWQFKGLPTNAKVYLQITGTDDNDDHDFLNGFEVQAVGELKDAGGKTKKIKYSFVKELDGHRTGLGYVYVIVMKNPTDC
jgi:hypothetical protein